MVCGASLKARRERGGHLAGRKDGSGETITLKSENALMGRLNYRCTDDLLVNCGQPPHISTMTPKIKIEADTIHQDVALARWEDEGGSSNTFTDKPAPEIRQKQLPTNSVGKPVTEVTPLLGTGIY